MRNNISEDVKWGAHLGSRLPQKVLGIPRYFLFKSPGRLLLSAIDMHEAYTYSCPVCQVRSPHDC